MSDPAALVVAGPPAPGLAAALGEERAGAVRRVLLARTLAAAREHVARVAVAEALPEEELGRGPLLLLRALCPRLGAEHVGAALADLGAGCDAVYGPTLDGDWYLAGLAAPRAELLARSPFAVAREQGLEVGLLRHERALRGPGDVAAFLADPLTSGDVRAALAG
ncbi:MAG TPA: DUF2064 domain-containing protein [Solirubrobacteraceae bacterium]|nr:DUF2064 domain-containing protein [Solirubrobacteraceae bacterium]